MFGYFWLGFGFSNNGKLINIFEGCDYVWVFDIEKLYEDKKYRNVQVVELINEADKVFMDAVALKNYQEIFLEREKIRNIKLEECNDNEPFMPPISGAFIKNYVLEFTKLALACEITLKSHLLYKNFLVHCIDKSLDDSMCGIQKIEPITADNYKADHPHSFNLLKPISLSFNTILNTEYSKVLCLDRKTTIFLKMLKDARNVIHFPINLCKNSKLSNVDITLLVKFYNTMLVDFANEVIKNNNFNLQLMVKI